MVQFPPGLDEASNGDRQAAAYGSILLLTLDPHLILAGCAVFMFVVRLIACIGPTLRGLRIRPVEALKES